MIFLVGLYLTSICHGHNVNGSHSSLHVAFIVDDPDSDDGSESGSKQDTVTDTGNENHHDMVSAQHLDNAGNADNSDRPEEQTGFSYAPVKPLNAPSGAANTSGTQLCTIGPGSAPEGSIFLVGAASTVLAGSPSVQTISVERIVVAFLTDQASPGPEELPPRRLMG